MECGARHPSYTLAICTREPDHVGLHISPQWPSGWASRTTPNEHRPGTILDHRFTEVVYATVRRNEVVVGVIDRKNKVFQTGGEATNFILEREN